MVSCANQVTLTGGQKDELPPQMVASNPINNSVNFSAKEIRIEFNELIQVKNAAQILVSPLVDQKIKYTVNGKSLLIKLEDVLDDSTTYSFDFGKSLVDNNEGNPLNDFKFTVSTYDILDTISINGFIKDAFSKEVGKEYLVGLYKSKGFMVDSLKPMYYTLTNDLGEFNISGIRAGKYFLRVIGDDNRDFKLQKNESFGFSEQPLSLIADVDSIEIETSIDRNLVPLYEVNTKQFSTPFIVYSKAIQSLGFYKLEKGDLKVSLSKTRDTVFLGTKEREINVLRDNEAGGAIDTIYIPSIPKATKVPIPSISLLGEKIKGRRINLKSSVRIDSVNLDGFHFMKDSVELPIDSIVLGQRNNVWLYITKPEDLNGAKILVDSAAVYHETMVNNKYNGAVAFVADDQLGEIEFILENIADNTNYLVTLLDAKGTILRYKYLKDSKITFRKLYEGEYYLRVVIDSNKNKVWDSVDFDKMEQAEKVLIKGPFRLEKGWDLLGNKISL